MSHAPILPGSALLDLDVVTAQAGVILIKAKTRETACVACPKCGQIARRIHSRYQRTLLDLPWQGQSVRLLLRCRKLFCLNPECAAQIFVEPLPRLARRYAHKTDRLEGALRELALLAGGEAAARIAKAFGLLLSPDACLDLLHREAGSSPFVTPRVLGVDDFAFKRGRRYGTILIDLEKRKPIDLLKDRDAATLAQWLKAHPGIQIVSRDRASSYAEGIRQGAPEAVQVADRWHLLKNLGDALERLAHRNHALLRTAAQSVPKPPYSTLTHDPVAAAQPSSPASPSIQRRRARFERVKALQAEGISLREIARREGVSRNTILKLASADAPPEPVSYGGGSEKLRPCFVATVRKSWEAGEQNAVRLHAEIVSHGFTGSLNLVQRLVAPWRERPRRRAPTGRVISPSPRQVAYLLAVERERLDGKEELLHYMDALIEASPELARAREFALEFCRVIRERSLGGFASWRESVKSSGIWELVRFVAGLEQDLAAVEAGIGLEWSNGQVEGQVNRLKLLKRSMYGRGSFELLRVRVLHHQSA